MTRSIVRNPQQHIELALSNISSTGGDNLVATQDARNVWRRRYGRTISPNIIESALRSAMRGSMAPITDIARETVDTDPHLASVLQKRFGAVSQLPFEVRTKVGIGVNQDLADFYATAVREQLAIIKDFRTFLFLMAWALFDGRAAFEVKWREVVGPTAPGGGRVRMMARRIDWIHPRRINFGPFRELRIVDENNVEAQGEFAPVGLSLAPDDLLDVGLWRKFIQWCPHLFADYQEREGLALRCLYWSFFKRFSARDRMQLIELFGKPWRILEVASDSPASNQALVEADDIIDRLGFSSSARMPRGVSAKVIQPGQGAGETHQKVIEEVDKQISKLVLGQTGTTDGVPAGINSDQAAVMQAEQYMLLIRDSQQMSQVVTDQLVNGFIELNFGPEALAHAPQFILRFDQQTDRASELKRLDSALQAGLAIRRDQAYEVSGFTPPNPDDVVIMMGQPPTPPLSPVAPAVRPIVVYPQGQSPAVGEQNPVPLQAAIADGAEEMPSATIGSNDVAAVITVNEARAAQGLGPLMMPTGQPDPNGDLTIEQFRALQEAAANAAAASDESIAASRQLVRLSSDNVLIRACEADPLAMRVLASLQGFDPDHLFAFERACCQHDHAQPVSEWGSPEAVMQDGLRTLGTEAEAWADQYAAAVDGLGDALSILRALEQAHADIKVLGYAKELGDRMVHADALGALDHASEVGMVREPIAASKQVRLSFATDPLSQAIDFFIARTIFTRMQWENQTEEVRRTAFTVAGIQSEQMLQAIQFELARQIEQGNDLRFFKKAMRDRLQSNGMLPTTVQGRYSATHVETIFRTNVLNTYNHGRVMHAQQPEVLRHFPVWQIRAVKDARTRSTHRAADGIKLMATDPFWRTAYPPFGFNCRCRVKSLPATQIFGVSQGSAVSGLPDRGFTSGYPSLIRAL